MNKLGIPVQWGPSWISWNMSEESLYSEVPVYGGQVSVQRTPRKREVSLEEGYGWDHKQRGRTVLFGSHYGNLTISIMKVIHCTLDTSILMQILTFMMRLVNLSHLGGCFRTLVPFWKIQMYYIYLNPQSEVHRIVWNFCAIGYLAKCGSVLLNILILDQLQPDIWVKFPDRGLSFILIC